MNLNQIPPDDLLHKVVATTAALTGDDFFRELVRALADALQVRCAFVAEFREQTRRVRTLALCEDGEIVDNVEYDVRHTPCEIVLKGEIGYYPDNVREAFPENLAVFEARRIVSYLAIPMIDRHGRVLGHLAATDDRPMSNARLEHAVLRIFGMRAAAELERRILERERWELQTQNRDLQDVMEREHQVEGFIGTAPAMRGVFASIYQVADTDTTVLVTGETGTGKELIARALHSASSRRERPLVPVNCAGLPNELVESELFGHERGAFTGAIGLRKGRFELAHGGTLFLDEVGELPPAAQAKLLRALQEHQIERVGGSHPITVDARVIAATNRNLEEMVARGQFRADLYYRLHVFPIRLPPLRDRRADIPLLAHFFLDKYGRKVGRHFSGFQPESLLRLQRYHWPGNVRELQNVIERAVILGSPPRLEIRDPLAIEPATAASAAAAVDDVVRAHILQVLEQHRWVIEGPRGAAAVLNLRPSTLRYRMKQLGIDKDAPRRSA
jgi:formate hydrogenlyase transcriptional activator